MQTNRYDRRPLTVGVLLLLTGSVLRVAHAQVWEAAGSMAAARARPVATLLADGAVLVTGGSRLEAGGVVGLAFAERFDPATNQFTALNPMNFARAGHAVVRLQDGQVLIVGGMADRKTAIVAAERFDPATGAFVRAGSLILPRADPTATLLPDGRVLIVGGGDPATQKLTATAELYDPASGQFQTTGSLSGPRVQHRAVALSDGRVLILGGNDDRDRPLRGVEIYDPQSGGFSPHGNLMAGRSLATATLLPDGKILLAGGWQSGRVLRSVEIYDPATGESAIAGDLDAPRYGHTAVALADGRVLLAGGVRAEDGFRGDSILRTAELFDPSTGKLSPTASMADPRFLHEGVLLPDGRALILGGFTWTSPQDIRVLASAELYRH